MDTAPGLFRLFMLDGFSLSGEAMLLAALAAHPRIRILGDLSTRLGREAQDFVAIAGSDGAPWIAADDPSLGGLPPPRGSIVVVPSAAARPRLAGCTVVLARNPFSVVAGSGAVEIAGEGRGLGALVPSVRAALRLPPRNSPRQRGFRVALAQWCRVIDAAMSPHVLSVDPVAGVALLYARKMRSAYDSGGPILRHEDLLRDPESSLRRLIAHFGLAWHAGILEDFAGGRSRRVPGRRQDDEPAVAHKGLESRDRDKIYAITASMMQKFGYGLSAKGEFFVAPRFDDRFPAMEPALAEAAQ